MLFDYLLAVAFVLVMTVFTVQWLRPPLGFPCSFANLQAFYSIVPRLTVNGQRFEVAGLRDGETRTLDVGAALRASGTTATLEARGKPGGRATVVLHD